MFPPSAVEYREPMVGAGHVFVYAKQREYAQKYWISDLYPELMAFWFTVQDPTESARLVNELHELLTSFQSVLEIKNYFQRRKSMHYAETFDQAFQFFFNNRVTFSGTTDAGGFSPSSAEKRFTQSSIERIKPLANLLEGTRITNLDFEAVIQEHGQDVFLFLDPPHFRFSKIYGEKGSLSQFDHPKLAELLKTTTHKFLITLNDCREVRELYSWANIKDNWDLPYGMTNCNASHQPKRGNELLIFNYEDPTL
jgi:DNA adenine methylase